MKAFKVVFFLFALSMITLSSCKKEDDSLEPMNQPKPEPPVASFSMDKTTAEEGETITFTNESEKGEEYLWDFGDNEIAATEHASHYYKNKGTHTVVLTATNDDGSDEVSQEITITPFIGKKASFDQGGKFEFSFSTHTTFAPSGFALEYTGEGEEYFSEVGFGNLIFIYLAPNDYLSGAGFTIEAEANTPIGAYKGEFTITFFQGNQENTIIKPVLMFVE
jgi:PKD repeat protein